MQKNILNVTVKASLYVGEGSKEKLEKEFELTQDIELSNANQILISKHLVGGMDKVTGLAYKNMDIKAGTKKSAVANIVFVIDRSGSMEWNLAGYDESNSSLKRQIIAKTAIEGFLDKISTDVVEKNSGDVNLYMLSYNHNVMQSKVAQTNYGWVDVDLRTYQKELDPTRKRTYIKWWKTVYQVYVEQEATINTSNDVYSSNKGKSRYELNVIDNRVGPYHLKKTDTSKPNYTLQKSKDWLGNVNMLGRVYGGTNTTEGILAGLDILRQAKRQRIDTDKNVALQNFFILISDGMPTFFSANNHNGTFLNNSKFGGSMVSNGTVPSQTTVNSLLDVTSASKLGETNYKNLVDKVFLIGFSGVDIDKKFMGIDPTNPKNFIENILKTKITVDGYSSTVQGKSIYGAFKAGGVVAPDNVKAYDANAAQALVDALADIAKTISVDMAVYDGPAQMKP